MSDIKLFRLQGGAVQEVKGTSVALEKSLQSLMEQHLDDLLGVRFLASEYGTGKKHGGRVDTLGIDENGCPVIIEYKRAVNENVINQGLFYLDWLMDHKADFKLLVMDRIGRDASESISWGNPRLLCIAGDFTKYDEHAVLQMNRNIELIRYRHYGDLLLLELVNAVSGETRVEALESADEGPKRKHYDKTVLEQLALATTETRDRFETLTAYLLAMGDDVQMTTLKLYMAFKKLRNFACVVVQPKVLLIYVRLNPDAVAMEEGFTRDVRKIGHWATGDLEITITSDEDLKRAEPLLARAYEEN